MGHGIGWAAVAFVYRWVVESLHFEPTAASKQNQTAYLAIRTFLILFLENSKGVLVLYISVWRCRWNGSKQNWKCTRWRILLSWSRCATITIASHKDWLSPLSGGRRTPSTGPGNAKPWKSECEAWSSFGPPAEWGLHRLHILPKMRVGCSCRHVGFQVLNPKLSVGHQETFGWRTEAAGQSTTGRRSITSWDPLLEFTFIVRRTVSVLYLWCGILWSPWQTDGRDTLPGKVAASTHALMILELPTQNLVSLTSTPTSAQRKMS